jgi:hypothetical protein
MARLVIPPQRVETLTGAKRSGKAAELADGYFARVAKYIPGEIVALYIGAAGILKTVGKEDARLVPPVYWGIFLICLVLTPIYLSRTALKGQPKRIHLIVSTVAFVVWAYALGGLPDLMSWYRSWLGSLGLLAFSAISGAIEPSSK